MENYFDQWREGLENSRSMWEKLGKDLPALCKPGSEWNDNCLAWLSATKAMCEMNSVLMKSIMENSEKFCSNMCKISGSKAIPLELQMTEYLEMMKKNQINYEQMIKKSASNNRGPSTGK